MAEQSFVCSIKLMQQWLNHGYPGWIAALSFDVNAYQDALFTQLQVDFPPSLQQAVKQRRAEYLAGHYLAQQLLLFAGCQMPYLGRSEDRLPGWPVTFYGSISHHRNIAVCAVHKTAMTQAVGMDIEAIIPLAQAQVLQNEIANLAEQKMIESLPLATAITLLFSAKESLFKAMYPQIKRYFGFQQVELIELNQKQQHLTLRLRQTLNHDFFAGRLFDCFYYYADKHICTLVYF